MEFYVADGCEEVTLSECKCVPAGSSSNRDACGAKGGEDKELLPPF